MNAEQLTIALQAALDKHSADNTNAELPQLMSQCMTEALGFTLDTGAAEYIVFDPKDNTFTVQPRSLGNWSYSVKDIFNPLPFATVTIHAENDAYTVDLLQFVGVSNTNKVVKQVNKLLQIPALFEAILEYRMAEFGYTFEQALCSMRGARIVPEGGEST